MVEVFVYILKWIQRQLSQSKSMESEMKSEAKFIDDMWTAYYIVVRILDHRGYLPFRLFSLQDYAFVTLYSVVLAQKAIQCRRRGMAVVWRERRA